MQKELENYCARLIEVHEDAISAEMRKPGFTPAGGSSRPSLVRSFVILCHTVFLEARSATQACIAITIMPDTGLAYVG